MHQVPVNVKIFKTWMDYVPDVQSVLKSNHMFEILMDSGCSITATPCKRDFVELKHLRIPVTLNGVGGNHHVTQGGTVRYEVFNNKGQVVVLQTYAYFDPKLHLRLFSPQSFLNGLREKGVVL